MQFIVNYIICKYESEAQAWSFISWLVHYFRSILYKRDTKKHWPASWTDHIPWLFKDPCIYKLQIGLTFITAGEDGKWFSFLNDHGLRQTKGIYFSPYLLLSLDLPLTVMNAIPLQVLSCHLHKLGCVTWKIDVLYVRVIWDNFMNKM